VDNGSSTGYTNVSYPNVSVTAYWTINYYDSYQVLGMGSTFPSVSAVSDKTRGLLTGTRVYQTDQLAGYWTVYYYDSEGRVQETYAQHQLGGYDRTITRTALRGSLPPALART
jgi:hypothetical protein